MIPKLKNVLDELEKVAPTWLAEQWDNPGLQVGSYSQEVTKIFLALDATSEVLRSACKHKAQLLLTHHPLIFKPLSCLEIDTYPGNVIFNAAKSGISIVALHTNLDAAREGINDILACLMDLQHVEVLKEVNGVEYVGMGRIGDLTKPTRLSVVVEETKRILGADKLIVVGEGDAEISRVAVAGGAGASLAPLAFKKGADLLVTGDVTYHRALEAEAIGIALIDGGHFHTEKTAFRIFAEHLKEIVCNQGWEVEVDVDEGQKNPMHDF